MKSSCCCLRTQVVILAVCMTLSTIVTEALQDRVVCANGGCFTLLSGDPMDWKTASARCSELEINGLKDWSLPCISTARENTVARISAGSHQSFWTGFVDSSTGSDDRVYVCGSAAEEMDISDFIDMSRSKSEGEDCVVVGTPSWEDTTCKTNFAAVCSHEGSLPGCDRNQCLNGGVCLYDGVDFSCRCEYPWTGPRCEESGKDSTLSDPCHPNPCNGGDCMYLGGKDFSCECPSGSGGDLCDEDSSTAFLNNPLFQAAGSALAAVSLMALGVFVQKRARAKKEEWTHLTALPFKMSRTTPPTPTTPPHQNSHSGGAGGGGDSGAPASFADVIATAEGGGWGGEELSSADEDDAW